GKRGGPQPLETARIGLDVGLTHHGLTREVARERANDGPVPWRLSVDIVGCDDARCRSHVLDDDVGPPRNVLGEISCEQASAYVVVVADRVADDEADLLVAVKVLCGLRAGVRRDDPDCDQCRRQDPDSLPDSLHDAHPRSLDQKSGLVAWGSGTSPWS